MNPQGNKKSTNTAIAVVIAVVVVALFLGGLIYHSNTAVVGTSDTNVPADQQLINNPSTQTTVNNSTTTGDLSLNPTGLEVSDEVVGTGATAAAGDMVYVTYVGSLTNGQVFDQSSESRPIF